jgi:hypothetical protein
MRATELANSARQGEAVPLAQSAEHPMQPTYNNTCPRTVRWTLLVSSADADAALKGATSGASSEP